MNQTSLYERLGGYEGITAFVDDLLPRVQTDRQLGRFWQNRGDDGIERKAVADRLFMFKRRWFGVLHRSRYERVT